MVFSFLEGILALWLKLDVHLLQHKKIRLIRKHLHGDSIALLWVGMLCLAMDEESETLYVTEGVPYTTDDLAVALDFSPEIVEIGVALLTRYGMITSLDDGAIFINSLAERQELEKLHLKRTQGRTRQQKYRDRNAPRGQSNALVTRPLRNSNATEEEVEEEVEDKTSVGLKPDDTPKLGGNGRKPMPVVETTRNVIGLLNERGGFRYDTEAPGNRTKIKRLLTKGYTENQMMKVVAIKCKKWKGDPKFEQYLRPSTLFGPEKFDDYVGEYDHEVYKESERG